MQHYSAFEWMLFRSGMLSKRMENEMIDHLETCDECMEVYLSTLGETLLEPAVSVPGVRPASWTTRQILNQHSKTNFRQRWVSVALVLVFLMVLLGFTPMGQVVLAQIRTTLENLGNSLTEIFNLPKDSPYVQNVGQIQSAPETTEESEPAKNAVASDKYNIEIKLDQVLLEKDEITFGAFLTGDFPQDVERVQIQYRIFLDGERYGNLGGASWEQIEQDPPTWRLYGNVGQKKAQDIALDETHRLKISIDRAILIHGTGDWLDPDLWKNEETVEGPWVFELDVSGQALAQETRTWLLSQTLRVDGVEFTVDELSFSPLSKTLLMHADQSYSFTKFIAVLDDGTEFELFGNTLEGNYIRYQFFGEDSEKMSSASSLTLIPVVNRQRFQNSYLQLSDQEVRLESEAVTIDLSSAESSAE